MDNRTPVHEDFLRHDEARIGSERAFGFTFGAICALIAGIMLWENRIAFWPWIGGALLFATLAILWPRALRGANVVWFRFGLLLHRIVTPLVLGLMFFAAFTPIGLFMRVLKKRPLQLRYDAAAETYWIPRRPPGPPPDTFGNQF